jgi:pyruvate-formate lyase-activating enzyme
VASNGRGEVFEIAELEMTGSSLGRPRRPRPEEILPVVEGSRLYTLPGRRPVGWDPRRGETVSVDEYADEEALAACVFLAPAHTGLLHASYHTEPRATMLPLYAYTALGWDEDAGFVAAAVRVDPEERQDIARFDESEVEAGARSLLEGHRGNRLVEHLVENCARRWSCPAARNLCLRRWEAPIPISSVCNADCVGCISFQPLGLVPASMERLTIEPTVDEILDYAVPHLERAERPVVSFGQGCEGEPLLRAEVIREAVAAIRTRTDRGVINLNTNASRPDEVERLAETGLDSIRVSLNSFLPDRYAAYYRPKGYSLGDVLESARIMRRHGRWVSINYLTFPGVTDRPEEVAALTAFAGDPGLSMIQWRNLNIDPEHYMRNIGLLEEQDTGIGLLTMMGEIRRRFPDVAFGYFNPPTPATEADRSPEAPNGARDRTLPR